MADADLLTEISREAELLLCCARTSLEAEHADRMRQLLEAGIDWEALLGAALRHGVIPLLYWHLDATCPGAVPPATLNRLRQLFHLNLRRNLVFTGELTRILALFDRNRIPALPYKGPALAASVYGNLAFRQFSDLDILVRRRDVPEATDLLASMGYRPRLQLTGDQLRACLESQCELELLRAEGQLLVELHWEITPRYFLFRLPFEGLWDRANGGGSSAQGLPTLPPEETLLILCAHGTKHLWERLSWVSDVAELIRARPGIDWKSVLERARALGGERLLFLGLFLARHLLGARLPAEVAHRVELDPAVRRLATRVGQRLFQEPAASPGLLESWRFHLQARERLRDRLRYSVSLAATSTPRDWAAMPLPRLLFGLYAVLRPLRLTGKYGWSLVRRLSGNHGS